MSLYNAKAGKPHPFANFTMDEDQSACRPSEEDCEIHETGFISLVTPILEAHDEKVLREIYILLKENTKHDFTTHKPDTIRRRIKRRMALLHILTVEHYAQYLLQTPGEVQTLLRDVLIGVTRFFRDTNVFQYLADNVIPKLLDGKSPGAMVRVWVAGCSSGEEACSIAILLHEGMLALNKVCRVQVFATDINSQAVSFARQGHYPRSISADVSAERLATYFSVEADGRGYRVRKLIRDMLIFSEHDALEDPPFSKLDLVSCRNVLIYMSTEAQHRLMRLFHYALLPQGLLVLGTSEDVDEYDTLFSVLNRPARVYHRKQVVLSPSISYETPPVSLAEGIGSAPDIALSRVVARSESSFCELTEQALLQQFAPPCSLINEHGDILYLRGRMGEFLELAPGLAKNLNVLKMSRAGLGPALRLALQLAIEFKKKVQRTHLRVNDKGHIQPIQFTVAPVVQTLARQEPLFLVTMEALEEIQSANGYPEDLPAGFSETQTFDEGPNSHKLASQIAVLKAELRARAGYQQDAQDALQISYGQLKYAAEEMQSLHEELQSANEELETSKEELLTINMQLMRRTNDLEVRVAELTRLNNDMNNLLAGAGVGTIFVDHQQRILRFTPAIRTLMHLMEGDVGRPVGHLVCKLRSYNRLEQDVQQVLDTLVPKDVEVQSTSGSCYRLRVQPYRTLDNLIEGAVISFIEYMDIQPSA